MPAADYQLFVVDLRVIAQNNATFSVLGFLDSGDTPHCYEHAAVDANEISAEFLGERLQGLIYQVLTVQVIDRNVLLLGTKTRDFCNRNQS